MVGHITNHLLNAQTTVQQSNTDKITAVSAIGTPEEHHQARTLFRQTVIDQSRALQNGITSKPNPLNAITYATGNATKQASDTTGQVLAPTQQASALTKRLAAFYGLPLNRTNP